MRQLIAFTLFGLLVLACAGKVDTTQDKLQTYCAVDGAACESPIGYGTCKAGGCMTCTDGTDDALCAAAYGNNFSCVNAACASN